MSEQGTIGVESWTVDYGYDSEPEVIQIPHAWRQDVPVNYEGPVTYRTILEVPKSPSKLLFQNVSCHATVLVNGVVSITHLGIWDAFTVDLSGHAGKRSEIEVIVTKNGGPSHPLAHVASGSLPNIFHTFGGMFGPVTLVPEEKSLESTVTIRPRFALSGNRLFFDGDPFFPRGVNHCGWYPEAGHPNPPDHIIEQEVQIAKRLGFNCMKFCQWMPSHSYLDILNSHGLTAWIELPFLQDGWETSDLNSVGQEIERIVRQYRHHDNVFAWTLPSAVQKTLPLDFLKRIHQLIRNLTHAVIVASDSDFRPFTPLTDLPFFSDAVDAIAANALGSQVLFLDETSEVDVHRDIASLANEIPYWASTLNELNERGVRAEYSLPGVLTDNRFANFPTREKHRALMESSRKMALFQRKAIHEWARSKSAVSGIFDATWRDTPIGSSGYLDDWDQVRFLAHEVKPWNGDIVLFLQASKRVEWLSGGYRPVQLDTLNHFVGNINFRVGLHSAYSKSGGLIWKIMDSGGQIVATGAEPTVSIPATQSTLVADFNWHADSPGSYRLLVEFNEGQNEWPIWIVEAFGAEDQKRWSTTDPGGLLGLELCDGALSLSCIPSYDLAAGVQILTGEGTLPMPFWRQAAYEFLDEAFWNQVPFAEQWARLLPISGDRVIHPDWLKRLDLPYQVLMKRIDVKTYDEYPTLVKVENTFVTTLRPFGGLGAQPTGLAHNPAGVQWLRSLADTLLRGNG